MTIPILLDTDLGSVPVRTAVPPLRDAPVPAAVGPVDDELALALLWGSPEVALRGVCTTYGDVALRAAIALRMAALTGRLVEVAPGETTPLSGKDVWWAGIEGVAYGDLAPYPIPNGGEPSDGVWILLDDDARSNDDDAVQLLAIGPLTSVAVALAHGLEVAGITLMGGDWADPSAAEHNIASDVVAARRVLGSGLPITVVGIDGTRRVRFDEAEVARFEAIGELGRVVAAEMRAWMTRWSEDFEVPHDPLTALALLEPELFTFAPPVAVAVSEEGAVRQVDGPGTVRVATGVDAEAARTAMADRIARGLGEQHTHDALGPTGPSGRTERRTLARWVDLPRGGAEHRARHEEGGGR